MSSSYKLCDIKGVEFVVIYDEDDPAPKDVTPINEIDVDAAEKARSWRNGTEQKSEQCVGHLAGDPTRLRVFLSMRELFESGYEYLGNAWAPYCDVEHLLEIE
jgi:hypothetical protein